MDEGQEVDDDMVPDPENVPSKNRSSSIQSRWTLIAIDLNSAVDILVSTEQHLPPTLSPFQIIENCFSPINVQGKDLRDQVRHKIFYPDKYMGFRALSLPMYLPPVLHADRKSVV